MGVESEPKQLQLGAELHVVVDLAVVYDPVPLIGRAHRLMTGRTEIDDGKAAMAEGSECWLLHTRRVERSGWRIGERRAVAARRCVFAPKRIRCEFLAREERKPLVVGP